MSKKLKAFYIISAVIFVVAIVVIIVSILGLRQIDKGRGITINHWPFFSTGLREFSAMYSQEPNLNVKTTQSPEETHAKFIEFMKKKDIDGAVNCCVVPSKRGEMKEFILGVEKKGMYDLMVGDIEEIKEYMPDDLNNSNSATYEFIGTNLGVKNSGGLIRFIKNAKGVWLIESL